MADCTCHKLLFNNLTGVYEEKSASSARSIDTARSWRKQNIKFGSIIVLEYTLLMDSQYAPFERECYLCKYHRGADLKASLDALCGGLDAVTAKIARAAAAPRLPDWAFKSLLRRVDAHCDGWHVADEVIGFGTPDTFPEFVRSIAEGRWTSFWFCARTKPKRDWLLPIKRILADSISNWTRSLTALTGAS
ncbi:hypothetical protein H9P43_006052 [Blastocladiella emersonii ATCC 22665]|nr:hypothetical protein H9P43_006052 [Blastocladiella emersonii ATCC 22665]